MIPGITPVVVVAAMGTVYAVSGDEAAVSEGLIPIIRNHWGLPTAFAFWRGISMHPCMATIATIKRESNSGKYTAMIVAFLFVLAYIAALLLSCDRYTRC